MNYQRSKSLKLKNLKENMKEVNLLISKNSLKSIFDERNYNF